MYDNTKHFIITRLAIKLPAFNEQTIEWEDWVKQSIHLMDTYCRPSLRNQTNQNFTLLTVTDKSVSDIGTPLKNEIHFRKGKEYKGMKMLQSLRKYCENINSENFIFTRLDRDDCLRYDYVENVQKYFNSKDLLNTYADVSTNFLYFNTLKNKSYWSNYARVSPFVSSFETKNANNSVTLIPYSCKTHLNIGKEYSGKKLDSLRALTVIHENNIKNNISLEKRFLYTNEVMLDYSKFGLNVFL